jgi:hypothetical protein
MADQVGALNLLGANRGTLDAEDTENLLELIEEYFADIDPQGKPLPLISIQYISTSFREMYVYGYNRKNIETLVSRKIIFR